nr:hypothetical protein [Tanacetum cinerariifolium]
MHTSKDDYLINTLRFVSTKKETQNYGAIILESLTSHEMKETQAYQTYLAFATGATPPKKSKRVKRPAKKSTKTLARGVVIRETLEMPLSKKKEKMTVDKRKGINLLSEVSLTKEVQFEEVQKKSIREFYKTHPSGSGTITKTTLSVSKIKPSATSEGTGIKPGVLDVAEEESSESKAESWVSDEDDSNNEQVSSDEDSNQEKDSDGEKTQSDNELNSDLEHETNKSESGSESDHDESKENE